ncbi:MAG: hypothetical protein R3F29_13710 [Planctomycetota bacterium]
MNLPQDILDAVRHDFGPGDADAVLSLVAGATESTRVQRCIVFAARGHRDHLENLCRLAQIDYRDVIMAAEYSRLDQRLYDFNRPIPEAALPLPRTGGD